MRFGGRDWRREYLESTTGSMTTSEHRAILKSYALRVRNALRAHPDNTEPGLAPEFHRMLVEMIGAFPGVANLAVIPEFRNPGVGRPDLALVAQGRPARTFIELKAINKQTDGARWRDPHDRSQFKRFSEFALWATCNFHEVRLYERNDSVGHAALVPESALDPDRDDRRADQLIDRHDAGPAIALIERLARAQPQTPENAEQLAELLAYSARLVRGIVKDRLAELATESRSDTPLQQVRQEFRDVLYSHPEAAGYSNEDFDELFSAAFAQTLAFGLLLVREATGSDVDRHAYEHMPPEHPLMRTALRVLSMDDVAREIGAGFDVLLDTVNGFEPAMLALREEGPDPILYFYENFLATFDPDARQRYGVYYTPIEVVHYMVGALDRALRENLAMDGLADERVHILDPATGTGTFLLGVADRVRRDAEARHGGGQGRLAVQGLSRRMYGFELLVGPYAVAHYRLHHALSRPAATNEKRVKAAPKQVALPRLGVYLTDTLAEPGAAAPLGQLGFVTQGIRDERAESNRIKTEQQILAIIGNPPYRRLEAGETQTLVGSWMGGRPDNPASGLWDDLKAPVRDAGYGNQLNTFPELSVAFWRWSIWKLFEAPNAPRRGVIALITNRKFLTGWPYAGLRKMLRERFDRIEIIDLRGDVRLGARAGVEGDEGVFNIKVGTAITLAIADGGKTDGALATVNYNDTWAHDLVSREQKLQWLANGADDGRQAGDIAVIRQALEGMRPLPFMNGALITIVDCFESRSSGIETTRDHLSYGFDVTALQRQVEKFLTLEDDAALALYSQSRKANFAVARTRRFDRRLTKQIVYRPLDRRTVFDEPAFVDWPRSELQSIWGSVNRALFVMPSGTGNGPACWACGNLPDRHAFRGSYGGYAFPLYDRRPGHGPHNLNADLIEALSDAYAEQAAPEQIFDAILCLLSARSYTTRFAEDLEDVFPHVPFPARIGIFRDAARVGAEIRAVETFARPPGERFLSGVAVAETAPSGPLAAIPDALDEGGFNLCADGSGRISHIPVEVWDFAVSGYRVMPRWLAAREGVEIGPDFIPQLRDVAGRIGELLFLFTEADAILEATLGDSLTRAALHLGESANEEADDGPN